MVRFLLEAGADQEHKTDEMHTALMEASMDGHVEVARLLLDSGAQVPKKYILYSSIADPGCLSRIPDPDFYPPRISDPGSKNSNKGEG
jgi:ankyrin repeat protein